MNHRVLIWNTIPTANNTAADIVLGQAAGAPCAGANRGGTLTANTLSSPNTVEINGNVFVVSDAFNYRILFYDFTSTALTSGQDATYVLGAANFTTTGTTFSTTNQFILDGTKMWISDGGNHRVITATLPYTP